jgi:hypothetical protein
MPSLVEIRKIFKTEMERKRERDYSEKAAT